MADVSKCNCNWKNVALGILITFGKANFANYRCRQENVYWAAKGSRFGRKSNSFHERFRSRTYRDSFISLGWLKFHDTIFGNFTVFKTEKRNKKLFNKKREKKTFASLAWKNIDFLEKSSLSKRKFSLSTVIECYGWRDGVWFCFKGGWIIWTQARRAKIEELCESINSLP